MTAHCHKKIHPRPWNIMICGVHDVCHEGEGGGEIEHPVQGGFIQHSRDKKLRNKLIKSGLERSKMLTWEKYYINMIEVLTNH